MNQLSKTDQIVLFGIHRPKTALLASLLILASLIYCLKFFKTNFSSRIWHAKDSPVIQALNDFEATFGGDEVFILAIDHQSSIFQHENLARLQQLTEDLWLLPGVLRVDSLSNFNHITSGDDEIIIDKLVPKDFTDGKQIEKKADQIDEIQDIFIDQSKNLAIIQIRLKPSMGENPDYLPFTQALYQLLYEKYQLKNQDLHFLGTIAVANAFKDISQEDSSVLIPVMFGMIFLILGLYFKTAVGVLIPLVIVIVTVIEAFGFLALKGIEFNSILGSIPGVLLGICLADSIHILTVFYQQMRLGANKHEAIQYSLLKNKLPTLLTTITTAISFFSISFTDLVPVHDLGLIAFFGTFMAWFNTYTLIPALIILMPNIFIGSAKSSNGLFQIDLSKWIIKYRYIFVAVFILAGILSTIKSFDNHANSDPLKYFTTNTKIRQSFDLAEKRLGSIRTHHIVIDSGQNHGIKDPAFLKAVDSFTREVLALDYVKKVNSILNIVKDMNQKLNNDQVSFHQVPDSNPHIAQLLLMYEMGSSADRGINHLVSMNRRKINMTINWKVETTQDSMIKNDQIISIAKKWGLDAHAAGTFSMIAGVNDKVVDSFYQSMGMAIILVSLVMLIVFRNFLYSTLAMLPNLVPLLFVGAYTATAGIFIDVGASIVFTICLGIAVDDTIHFMSQFILNKKNASTEEALSKTFLTSGEALILTTVVLVVGFGSFIFAKFLPNKNFGTLSSMVLLFALLTDLIFLPSILTIFNGKKQKA